MANTPKRVQPPPPADTGYLRRSWETVEETRAQLGLPPVYADNLEDRLRDAGVDPTRIVRTPRPVPPPPRDMGPPSLMEELSVVGRAWRRLVRAVLDAAQRACERWRPGWGLDRRERESLEALARVCRGDPELEAWALTVGVPEVMLHPPRIPAGTRTYGIYLDVNPGLLPRAPVGGTGETGHWRCRRCGGDPPRPLARSLTRTCAGCGRTFVDG